MKKLIMTLSFIFAAHLLHANDAQSTVQKMEFILERIAAFDEKGVEQLLQRVPFTQREIDACIDYIEKYGADLIDPAAKERVMLAYVTPAICVSLMGLVCKFDDKDIDMPGMTTLICAYVAFSFLLHPLLSYGMSAEERIRWSKLIRIARRLLAYKPQHQAELIVESV